MNLREVRTHDGHLALIEPAPLFQTAGSNQARLLDITCGGLGPLSI